MNEAVQHVNQGTDSRSLVPSNTDLLRIAVLVMALIIIALRCHMQYLLKQEAKSNPVVYLHLRSLDGYRAGIPVYIANHLASRPKSFILIPSTSEDLSRERTLWNTVAPSADIVGFPVIVCIDRVCPLGINEHPGATNGVVVLDRLQYIPAYAVAQAMEQHHLLILNSSMIVQESLAIPETPEGVQALLRKEIR